MTGPRVAIIYLCHGNQRHLKDVVASWERQSYPQEQMKIWLVPNGSPDGIVDDIRQDVLPRAGVDLPEMTMIDDGINRGFAGGNNHAMQAAIDEGYDYIFLNNGDLYLADDTIEQLVTLAESDDRIGAVQAMVHYWHQPELVNTSGGVIHIAGYGYARDNRRPVSELNYRNGEDIAYPSGAAVLYRATAIQQVGLLEEGFFMYHEDLELGLRLRFADWRTVLCTEASTYHDYNFHRNPKKIQWMELYRMIVLAAYLDWRSMIVLSPLLVILELGTWIMAIKGGWMQAKIRAVAGLLHPSNWRLAFRMRRRAQGLRVIKDQDWVPQLSAVIDDGEGNVGLMAIANRAMAAVWFAYRRMIIW